MSKRQPPEILPARVPLAPPAPTPSLAVPAPAGDPAPYPTVPAPVPGAPAPAPAPVPGAPTPTAFTTPVPGAPTPRAFTTPALLRPRGVPPPAILISPYPAPTPALEPPFVPPVNTHSLLVNYNHRMVVKNEEEVFCQYGQDGDSDKLLAYFSEIDFEDKALLRLLDGSQQSLPPNTSEPVDEPVENPTTPPPESQDRPMKIQYRLGKKDWEMLVGLNFRLNALVSEFEAFNEFIHRKQFPELNERVNLADFDKHALKSTFEIMLDNAAYTRTNRHLLLKLPLPPRFNMTNAKRINVTIKHQSGKTANVVCSSVVIYFKPSKCYNMNPDGSVCIMRHRTVQEFCDEHPEVATQQVHVSHLCHYPTCLNWKHLVLETSKVNLHRNKCRRDCNCGGFPRCFKDRE